MPNDDMPIQEEQYESIPWSHLVEQAHPQPWLSYVAAAAVVAVVIGVVIARGSPPAPSVPAAVAAPAGSSTTAPAPPAVRSEQDLMAAPVAGAGERAAVMRAEWFVRDYFTTDGAGGRAEELAAALGWSPVELESPPTSYVEWARAWSAEPGGDGTYRVSVAYRSITETESGFERGLAHGVAVTVDVDEGGGTRVMDLPEPIELPRSPRPAVVPEPTELPQPVADLALDDAARWGDPVAVLGGADAGDAWRVVVTIADDFGTPWPMMVRVQENPGAG